MDTITVNNIGGHHTQFSTIENTVKCNTHVVQTRRSSHVQKFDCGPFKSGHLEEREKRMKGSSEQCHDKIVCEDENL